MPEGEREEIRQVYAAKGFCGDDLERIVEVITSDRQVWLDTMMREELGYGSDVTNPLRAATSTLVAFIAIGFLPLGAFVYDLVMPGDVAAPFAWSAVLTGLAFLIVGALKARVRRPGRRGGRRWRPSRSAAPPRCSPTSWARRCKAWRDQGGRGRSIRSQIESP